MLRSAPKGDLSEPARFEGGLFYILLQARPAPRGKTAGCHSVTGGSHKVQAPRDSSRATFDPRQLCQQTWRAVHSTPMPILSAFNPKGTCPIQPTTVLGIPGEFLATRIGGSSCLRCLGAPADPGHPGMLQICFVERGSEVLSGRAQRMRGSASSGGSCPRFLLRELSSGGPSLWGGGPRWNVLQ